MSLPVEIRNQYVGPHEVVWQDGRVRVIEFHGEARGWGYDTWVGTERIGAATNTDSIAISAALGYVRATL